MTITEVVDILRATALDPRVLVLPLLLGSGVYLILTAAPFGRPKPDLGERLRQLDVDERIRMAELGRSSGQRLFSSRLLENMLRPIVEDVGRGLRIVSLRLGLGGGRELELRLRVVRPGVDVAQFMGEKVAAGVIAAAVSVSVAWPSATLLLGVSAPAVSVSLT